MEQVSTNALALTKSQQENYVDFWVPRGRSLDELLEGVIYASTYAWLVLDLYNTLTPTKMIPNTTVRDILTTIEKANSMVDMPWQGKSFTWGGYGLANLYLPDGRKTTRVAHRVMDELITGRVLVNPIGLDHINHNFTICTDKRTCRCTRDCSSLNLVPATKKQNNQRSNGSVRSEYCRWGHDKNGMTNCPDCKREQDRCRQLVKSTQLWSRDVKPVTATWTVA